MSTTTLARTDREFVEDVHELFCRGCGYGIVVRRDPPDCPMCRRNEWREQPRVAHWN